MEGLSAGKPVVDLQYKYTCSQSLCQPVIYDRLKKCIAGRNGTENDHRNTKNETENIINRTESNNKTELSANGHTVLIPCNANNFLTPTVHNHVCSVGVKFFLLMAATQCALRSLSAGRQ